MQHHQHFGAAREGQHIGRTESETGGESQREIIGIVGQPVFKMGDAVSALRKQKIPGLPMLMTRLDARRVNNPVPDRKQQNIGYRHQEYVRDEQIDILRRHDGEKDLQQRKQIADQAEREQGIADDDGAEKMELFYSTATA